MFNLSLTACSFHLRKTNSRGNTKIFNLNMPLTLQKEDGTECDFQDLSDILDITPIVLVAKRHLNFSCSVESHKQNTGKLLAFLKW